MNRQPNFVSGIAHETKTVVNLRWQRDRLKELDLALEQARLNKEYNKKGGKA